MKHLPGLMTLHFGRISTTSEKIRFADYEFTVLKKIISSRQLVQLHDLEGSWAKNEQCLMRLHP
jgi:Mg2+/Co2+ transporter CorC